MKKIAVIILNYKGIEDTLECIESVLQHEPEHNECFLVVVDNASNDGSVTTIKEQYENRVAVIESRVNVGYAAGNNLGIEYALKEGADYICILNNDTVVCDNFFDYGVGLLETDKTLGVISPVVIDYKGGFVQSTGGDIDIKKALVTQKNYGKNREDLPDRIECDYVGGACMLFRRELIDAIGRLPECYFLFFEETEWCYLAKRKKLKNICFNNFSILHKGSVSIKKTEGLSRYMMERNRIVFLKRNNKYFDFFKRYLYLRLKAIYHGLRGDKGYFSDFHAYADGKKGIINKKYPFVYIKE